MALFGIFKKDNDKKGTRKGFHQLEVAAVKKLTEDSVKIELNVPQDLKGKYRKSFEMVQWRSKIRRCNLGF